MLYHAFYSKAKTAGYIESFYLKQLSIPDKYFSDLEKKKIHSSSEELHYFVVQVSITKSKIHYKRDESQSFLK